jgi:D-cysteine desulfhydrase
MTTRYEYEPPIWVRDKLQNVPGKRLCMANLPTPLYQWTTPSERTSTTQSSIMQRLRDLEITLYIKRDDMTGGCETGGNKIRKLEFLLADALDQGCDKVITIGGEQSNHCRATASACRMLGLEPHLILRTDRANDIQKAPSETDGGMGFTGNILFDRLVGSHIYTCTPGEYGRVGSKALVSRLSSHLEKTSKGRVYPIPVGGSNGLGTWGYIDGVDEVLSQWSSIESKPPLDHVIFACGSGGTAAGIAVGMGLAFEHDKFKDWRDPTVHAMGVCDSPDYFYQYVARIADEMGIVVEGGKTTEEFIRQCMTVHQGKGRGYAASSPEELEFISELSLQTGVVLDPVYSGKALYHFFTNVLNGDDAEKYRGTNILFWHTGGALGLFDKAGDLSQRMADISPVKRLDIYGKGGTDEINISQSPEETK